MADLFIQDEGVTIVANPQIIDFTGPGVSATVSDGTLTIEVSSCGGGLVVQDEGLEVAQDPDVINFKGSGVTTELAPGNRVDVVINRAFPVENEGVNITGDLTKLNFVGDGVTATSDLTGNVTVTIDGGGGGGGGGGGAPTEIPFSQAIPFDGNYVMPQTNANMALNFTVDTTNPPVLGAAVRVVLIGRGRTDDVLFTGIKLLKTGFDAPVNHNWGVKNFLTFEYTGVEYTCRVEKGITDMGDLYVGSDPSYVVFQERQGFYSAPANRFLRHVIERYYPDTPPLTIPYLEGTSYEWPMGREERFANSAIDNQTVAIRNGRNVARARLCWATGSQHALTPNSTFEWSVSVYSGQVFNESYAIVFSRGRNDRFIFTPDGTDAERERVYISGGHSFFYGNNYTGDLTFEFLYSVGWEFSQTNAGAVRTTQFMSNSFNTVTGIYRPLVGNTICYERDLYTGAILSQQPLNALANDLWPHLYFTNLQGGFGDGKEEVVDGGFQFVRKFEGPPMGLIV